MKIVVTGGKGQLGCEINQLSSTIITIGYLQILISLIFLI
jgi:dTDP-4-dehydrorhamnose reductase